MFFIKRTKGGQGKTDQWDFEITNKNHNFGSPQHQGLQHWQNRIPISQWNGEKQSFSGRIEFQFFYLFQFFLSRKNFVPHFFSKIDLSHVEEGKEVYENLFKQIGQCQYLENLEISFDILFLISIFEKKFFTLCHAQSWIFSLLKIRSCCLKDCSKAKV